MDDLAFRRAVYADPNTKDPEIIAAANADPAKKALLNELKALDKQLASASKIPVPDDLAHKLIWQGTITDFARHKKRSRIYLSIAASVAFVVGLSFTLWQQHATVNISSEALAHMYYTDMQEAPRASAVSLDIVNDRLAGYGASLASEIGVIKSANYCRLDSVKSLHLILETASGLVSVFVLPDDRKMDVLSTFSDTQYAGETLKPERANVLVVGDKGQDLTPIKQEVEQKLLFSA